MKCKYFTAPLFMCSLVLAINAFQNSAWASYPSFSSVESPTSKVESVPESSNTAPADEGPTENNCTAEKPCTSLVTKMDGGSTSIVENSFEVKSSVPVKIEESQVTSVVDGKKETLILPSQVKKVVETEVSGAKLVPGESKIQKMELTTCTSAFSKSADCSSNTSVYETRVERVDKLFGFIPVTSQVNYTVGASNGQVLGVAKPWYLNLFSVFFR